MLQSLDPYTEFEDLKAARNMQESVSGKYGGVGLIIAKQKPIVMNNNNLLEITKEEDKINIPTINGIKGYIYIYITKIVIRYIRRDRICGDELYA